MRECFLTGQEDAALQHVSSVVIKNISVNNSSVILKSVEAALMIQYNKTVLHHAVCSIL